MNLAVKMSIAIAVPSRERVWEHPSVQCLSPHQPDCSIHSHEQAAASCCKLIHHENMSNTGEASQKLAACFVGQMGMSPAIEKCMHKCMHWGSQWPKALRSMLLGRRHDFGDCPSSAPGIVIGRMQLGV